MSSWKTQVVSELKYYATRAQGAGGQHVNRTDSAVLAEWDFAKTLAFTEADYQWLKGKLSGQLNSDGILQVRSQEDRSQFRNKEVAVKKILALIEKALIRPKKRVATKPKKSAIRKRLETKNKQGQKKELRRKVI